MVYLIIMPTKKDILNFAVDSDLMKRLAQNVPYIIMIIAEIFI